MLEKGFYNIDVVPARLKAVYTKLPTGRGTRIYFFEIFLKF